MFKHAISALAIVVMIGAGVGPASAIISTNGWSENGLNPNALSDNALSDNALGGNALSDNALSDNALVENGVTIQGQAAARVARNGLRVIEIEMPSGR